MLDRVFQPYIYGAIPVLEVEYSVVRRAAMRFRIEKCQNREELATVNIVVRVSAWWPRHFAAAEQVEMEVIDRLTAIRAAIYDYSISVFEFQFARQIADNEEHVPHQVGVVVRDSSD
jgi:hypothetical protein